MGEVCVADGLEFEGMDDVGVCFPGLGVVPNQKPFEFPMFFLNSPRRLHMLSRPMI